MGLLDKEWKNTASAKVEVEAYLMCSRGKSESGRRQEKEQREFMYSGLQGPKGSDWVRKLLKDLGQGSNTIRLLS